MAPKRRTLDSTPAARWRRRTIGIAVALAIVCMLAAAGYGFVLKSLPYHTPQLAPPQIKLTSADLASFAEYPGGVRGVPVLTWRDISHRSGLLVTTPARFATELAVLRRDGFQSITQAALAALAAGRHVALPARPVLLAFDGGLSTDWTTVDPILRQYGFTAVVFIDPSDIALKSPSYFLTSAELAAMAATGRWTVGLQLADERLPMTAAERRAGGLPRHGRLELETATEWSERTATDALRQQRKLAQITGHPVTSFAWPVAQTQSISDREAPKLLYPVLRRLFRVVFGRPASGAATFVTPATAESLPRLEITAATTLQTLSASIRTGVPSPPPADPLTLPWRSETGSCPGDHGTLKVRGHGFQLCTVNANGSQWRDYQLSMNLGFAKSATGLTAIIELRLSTTGLIEVAIGSVGVKVEQLVGDHVSSRMIMASRPLAADGTTESFLRSGRLPAVLRLAGSVLAVQVGGVAARIPVSPALDHGVIAVGFASASGSHRQSVSFSGLHISDIGPSSPSAVN
jgi:hypothetical protein